jgi:hypothetical protein
LITKLYASFFVALNIKRIADNNNVRVGG